MQSEDDLVLSLEEQKAMEEAFAARDEMEAEEREKREAVLGAVRARVDVATYAAIEQCIEDSDDEGSTRSYAIVDKACGHVVRSDYAFGDYHVHQYENGGLSGDSYAGAVYIAIGSGQYLEFHYEI